MSTQLRDMFDAAAESELPNGMAERAIGAAQQRRRQRYVVGGAVVATAAVVLGVVVAVSDVRMDAEPKPSDVASIPNRLPKADGLPVADYAAMTAASAAYVSDGELVLVDSTTGEPARAREGAQDQPESADWFSIPANDVFLSPDGRWAVVGFDVSRSSDKLKGTRLLNVDSGEWSVLEGMTFADEGVVWPQQSVLAWAPDSTSFIGSYVVSPGSAPSLARVSVAADSGPVVNVEILSGPGALQVSAGVDSYAVQFEGQGGPWLVDGDAKAHLPAATMLALSADDPDRYLAADAESVQIGSFTGRGDELVTTTTFQRSFDISDDRPVFLQASSSGWVMGWQFGGTEESGVSQHTAAYTVSADGVENHLTTFPAATDSVSFAGDLVTIPAGVKSIPAVLPRAGATEPLVEGAVDSASGAYIEGGELVVLDSGTGEAFRVDDEDLFERHIGLSDTSQLTLSPDGRYVAVSSGVAVERWDAEPVWFVDVAKAVVAFQRFALVAVDPGQGHPLPARMTWSPDGETFICVCKDASDIPGTGLTEVATDRLVRGSPTSSTSRSPGPSQVAWGAVGLVGEFTELGEGGEQWRLAREEPGVDFGLPESLEVLKHESIGYEDPAYLSLSTTSAEALVLRESSGMLTLIHSPATAVTQVDGGFGRIDVSPVDGGFLISLVDRTWPTDVMAYRWVERGDGEVEWVGHNVTAIPSGVTAVSFAADQVVLPPS